MWNSLKELEFGVQLAAGCVTILGTACVVFLRIRGRTRREQITAIGKSFQSIVSSLTNGEDSEKLVSAVLMRRFFRVSSEFGYRNWFFWNFMPYSREAVEVIAGMLKDSNLSAPVRKILADGLREAPSLENFDFQHADFGNVFLGTKLKGEEIDISNSDFYRATIQGSFHGVKGIAPVFRSASAEKTVFSSVEFEKANFVSARISGATFSNARLFHCDFARASVDECNFEEATLHNCIFDGLTINSCKFNNATISKSTFCGAVLKGVVARNCNFSGSNFEGATFQNCDLKGADFSGAKLTNCKFPESDVADTKGLSRDVAE